MVEYFPLHLTKKLSLMHSHCFTYYIIIEESVLTVCAYFEQQCSAPSCSIICIFSNTDASFLLKIANKWSYNVLYWGIIVRISGLSNSFLNWAIWAHAHWLYKVDKNLLRCNLYVGWIFSVASRKIVVIVALVFFLLITYRRKHREFPCFQAEPTTTVFVTWF